MTNYNETKRIDSSDAAIPENPGWYTCSVAWKGLPAWSTVFKFNKGLAVYASPMIGYTNQGSGLNGYYVLNNTTGLFERFFNET